MKMKRILSRLILCSHVLMSTLVHADTTTLIVKKHPFMINGQSTELYKIEQPDGTWGYHGVKGSFFDATVKNEGDEATVLHWHGLILPNDQDGIPWVTQAPILPGKDYHYHFALKQAGTFWMHSHCGLQEQLFLSAPFIIQDPTEKSLYKDVIMFLGDFSLTKPKDILAQLKHPTSHMDLHQPSGKMEISSHAPQKQESTLNDVAYDALLTNYKTLDAPEIIRVKPGETVRLRVIAGSSMSNFFINTGLLSGKAIAVDGNDIKPMTNRQFQLAVAQRIDILVKIPEEEGAYPILAQGEGTTLQTGLILATEKAKIKPLSQKAIQMAGALNYNQEKMLKAIHPLKAKKVQQQLKMNLEGNMMTYTWTINHQAWPQIKPIQVDGNQRIELEIVNQSMMAHPIHLHGHVFEVTEIDGQVIHDGAMRDTVLVLPHSTVKVQFDSDNPGNWMLHCHMLYHMASGMVTFVNYQGVNIPDFKKACP